MDEAIQPFFTVGFPCHLESLPTLHYSLVPSEHDESSDSEDELNAGQGMRLLPQLVASERQPWPVIMRNITSETFMESVDQWSKLLVLLDAADPDPHFAGLRRFFDTRLAKVLQEAPRSPEEALFSSMTLGESGRNGSPAPPEPEATGAPVERRGSFTPARLQKHFQWTRRPSLPAAMHARPQDTDVPPVPQSRSILGSMRRSSRRSDGDSGAINTDMYELWVASAHDEANARCVRFNVRLDLHAVRLAPSPSMTDPKNDARAKRAPSLEFTPVVRDDTNTPPTGAPSTVESLASDEVSGSASRRSFVHRILDRGLRKSSVSGAPAASSQAWMRNHDHLDPYGPENAEAIDSDDEVDHRREDRPAFGPRRSSSGSNAARSLGTHAMPSDLGRVEEDSLLEPSEYTSGLRSVMHESKAAASLSDSDVPGVSDGEDFLALLRRASATVLRSGMQSSWNRGADDALPSILSYAMAQAFGWEGVQHLCYGAGSFCAQEQVFAPLGRAADINSSIKKKHDAVLSWRSNVQAGGEEFAGFPSVPDQDVLTPRLGDEPDSPVEMRSTVSNNETQSEPNTDSAPRLARNVLGRSWSDWHALFSSIFGWVSEYETTRIRSGLAHEMGRENPQNVVGVSRRTGRAQPSPCIEADALNGAHGFQRLPGIPEALRHGPQGEEHRDFRWARSRLRSSHVHTPISAYRDLPSYQQRIRAVLCAPACHVSVGI